MSPRAGQQTWSPAASWVSGRRQSSSSLWSQVSLSWPLSLSWLWSSLSTLWCSCWSVPSSPLGRNDLRYRVRCRGHRSPCRSRSDPGDNPRPHRRANSRRRESPEPSVLARSGETRVARQAPRTPRNRPSEARPAPRLGRGSVWFVPSESPSTVRFGTRRGVARATLQSSAGSALATPSASVPLFLTAWGETPWRLDPKVLKNLYAPRKRPRPSARSSGSAKRSPSGRNPGGWLRHPTAETHSDSTCSDAFSRPALRCPICPQGVIDAAQPEGTSEPPQDLGGDREF